MFLLSLLDPSVLAAPPQPPPPHSGTAIASLKERAQAIDLGMRNLKRAPGLTKDDLVAARIELEAQTPRDMGRAEVLVHVMNFVMDFPERRHAFARDTVRVPRKMSRLGYVTVTYQ